MNSDEKRYENRKRCLACKHYGGNVCPLMCNADVFQIDNCILDDARVKQIKEGTAEWFMLIHNPVLFLRYLNYQRKEILPEVGTKVITLSHGFCGWAGAIRYIKSIDEKYITLVSNLNEDCSESISSIETWYNDFF